MKYTIETEINKPIDQVIKLYNEVDLYPHWMPGIVNHNVINGNKRETGTQSVYTIEMNGKNYEMKESVVKNDGAEIIANYRMNGVENNQQIIFKETSNGKTLYQVNENFDLKGFMKIIGFLMPSSFKNQTKKFVSAFKEFAEN